MRTAKMGFYPWIQMISTTQKSEWLRCEKLLRTRIIIRIQQAALHWLKLCIFMKSSRLDSSIVFGTWLCLDWRKTRVIRSFRVRKSKLPPNLHSLWLRTLLQTLPFLRFINSIKPVLGSLVVMGRSVWVAVVTDNFYHTFREKKLLSEEEKVPHEKTEHCKGWSILANIYNRHIPVQSSSSFSVNTLILHKWPLL